MKIGFYYHIPVYIDDQSKIWVPSFIGVFLESLGANCKHLLLYLHVTKVYDPVYNDYCLMGDNIHFHSMGAKKPAWDRMLFPSKSLKSLRSFKGDAFIVRSPSPLAPFIHKVVPRSKLFFLVVGDYAESIKQKSKLTLRKVAINLLLKWNNYLFLKEIKKSQVIVNSLALLKKYKPLQPEIELIQTTTLSETDFSFRSQTRLKEPFNLLYTGRIDVSKGLLELVQSCANLNQTFQEVNCHIVGWEDDKNKPIENELKQLAKKLNISNKLIFHGKKSLGEELNAFYRQADIYVLPSYHEGFPRTIWEAMANSLPVVATGVGSIPDYLTSGTNALIVSPKNSDELTAAIKTILSDHTLRNQLIANGFELAKNMTLEKQTKKLLDIVKEFQNQTIIPV